MILYSQMNDQFYHKQYFGMYNNPFGEVVLQTSNKLVVSLWGFDIAFVSAGVKGLRLRTTVSTCLIVLQTYLFTSVMGTRSIKSILIYMTWEYVFSTKLHPPTLCLHPILT